MAPTPQGKGVYNNGTTSVVIDADGIGGINADDILLIIVESSDSTTAAGTPNTPSGWTKLFEETQGAGATGVTTLTIFGKVAAGGETDVTVDGVGNHVSGTMFCIRGAKASLAAADLKVGTGTGANTGNMTAVPGITVDEAGCLGLLVGCSTRDAINSTNWSAWASANGTGETEWEDNHTNSGAGGGIGVAYFTAPDSGSTGDGSATIGVSAQWRGVQLIFEPGAVSETPTPGGAIAGGTAPAPSTAVGSGGAAAAGTSPAPAASVPIGGADVAGTGPAARVDVAPGGAIAGGTAPGETSGFSETPTPGGAIAGGTAPAASSSVPAGGALAGGTAPAVSVSTTTGGAIASGTAPGPSTSITAGGALAGGTGPTARVTFAPGGAIAGGTPPQDSSAVSETPTPGGAIAGGTGPTASAAVVIGGAAAGGSGPTVQVSVSAGGAIAGGVAPSEVGVSVPGEVVLTATWPAAVAFELGLAAGAEMDAASPAAVILDASEA